MGYSGPENVYRYRDASPHFVIDRQLGDEYYPCIIPNWDNSPRSGKNALILHDSTPELFRNHLRHALRRVEGLPGERRIVFIKSWNEWAEGNYLEPDQRHGLGYLKVLKEELATAGNGFLLGAAINDSSVTTRDAVVSV